ncbi:hypothetical protein GW916_15700, partial [bacterium]|nr:hypothetical protein [bacterium]
MTGAAGFSQIMGDLSYVFADNASFDGTERGGGLTTDGQLWIGNTSTGSPTVSTLTAGSGVSITNGNGSIEIALAGAGQAIDSIGTQSGVNPIAPTAAGLVTINGNSVVSGTNPVITRGTGANTMSVDVQISQAIAATDATKIGLSNFDSASFAVDANGFVTASGTGLGQTITGDTGGALSPTAGNWDIVTGVSTQNSGSSFSFAGSGSTLTLETTDALGNTIIGESAGNATLTSINCTALGKEALRALTNGGQNLAVGNQTLFTTTTGDYHTAIGHLALGNVTTGTRNTGVGYNCMGNVNSSDNTAMGFGAMRNFT